MLSNQLSPATIRSETSHSRALKVRTDHAGATATRVRRWEQPHSLPGRSARNPSCRPWVVPSASKIAVGAVHRTRVARHHAARSNWRMVLGKPRVGVPGWVAVTAACFVSSACGGTSESSAEEQAASVCSVTDLTQGTMPYTFDATTGRLTTRIYVFDIDEATRTIAVSGTEGGAIAWYWTDTFDEHGNLEHLEHRDGTLVDWQNTYEGGVLARVDVVPHGAGQGYQPTVTTYEHADPAAPELWTRMETDYDIDGSIDEVWVRTIEDGHAVRAEFTRASMEGTAAVWTYSYEGERLSTVERDAGF